MKIVIGLVVSLVFLPILVIAQKSEKYDIITFKTPKGWQKESQGNAVQIGAENSAGGICLVTIFKSIPGSNDSKRNFEAAWETIVEDLVTIKGKRQQNPVQQDGGWLVESGMAQYESDGKSGVVLLLTATGNKQIVNILMLTNTTDFEQDFNGFLESVQFPTLSSSQNEYSQSNNSTRENASQPVAPKSSRYKYNTTPFDDGWTAVEQEDWARVTKGNITVLVHYPNQQADAYNANKNDGLQNAWNVLVAPRYTNIRNFVLDPTSGLEYIYFAEADAVERSTGKNVHVTLVKKHYQSGNGRFLEFITNSKAEFDNEFGANRDRDYTDNGWGKITGMQNYNRFAVSPGDLVGKWATSDYASISYYYTNGGGYAGTASTSTADEFTFSNSGTYQSDHSGASGMVGNMKFSRQVYQGKFISDVWKLTLTNRFQGESENYNYYFEAIKGGRILVMTNRNNTVFYLVKQ